MGIDRAESHEVPGDPGKRVLLSRQGETPKRRSEAGREAGVAWLSDRSHPKIRWGAVNGFAPRKSKNSATRNAMSTRPTAKRANVRLRRAIFRRIVGAKGLRLTPPAVGALVLPRINDEIAAIEVVVPAVDGLRLTLWAGSGYSNRLLHIAIPVQVPALALWDRAWGAAHLRSRGHP